MMESIENTENVISRRSNMVGGIISLSVFTLVLLTMESFVFAAIASIGCYQGYKQVKK